MYRDLLSSLPGTCHKKGNLISEFGSDGKKLRDLFYDASGMPVVITDYDTDQVPKLKESYVYGIGGARLAKINNITKNYNLYFGPYEKKKDLSGLTESVNMDVPLASIIKVKKGSGAWVKNYTYANYQGSTAFILDSQGKYLPEFQDGAEYFRYFAYGGQINNINFATLPRENTYTGQKKDISTGLMYYNARYYNPANGLFQQADSVDDGLNNYAYVGGNPIMMTDPSGKFVNVIVGALIGGGADLAGQLVSGMITGKSFNESFQSINWAEVALSTAVGAATSGVSALANVGVGTVARVALSTAIEGVGNVAIQAVQGGGINNVNWTTVAATSVFAGIRNGIFEALPMVRQLINKKAISITDDMANVIELSTTQIISNLDDDFIGSSARVYRANIGGEDVAVKIFNPPTGYRDANLDNFFENYIRNEEHMAQVADRLGVGPKYHGLVSYNGQPGYAMGIVEEGLFPELNPGRINRKTYGDVRNIVSKVTCAGYDVGDFQYLVKPDGHAVMIDVGGMRKLESGQKPRLNWKSEKANLGMYRKRKL